jgi:hypothetical protein
MQRFSLTPYEMIFSAVPQLLHNNSISDGWQSEPYQIICRLLLMILQEISKST